MKMIIVLLAAVIAVVVARPASDKDVEILRYDSDNIGVGAYNFNLELSDGSTRQETAELKNVGSENEAMSVRGSFSYIVDGVTYLVNYVADENGFQPEGAHLPKAE